MRPAKFAEIRGAAVCVEMRVASMSPNCGSSARDVSGMPAGSVARVRLKCVVPPIGGSHIYTGPAR